MYLLISPETCRAARALLNWSRDDLAERCGISKASIARFEQGSGGDILLQTIRKIEQALSEGGVEFLPDQGLRLKKKD